MKRLLLFIVLFFATHSFLDAQTYQWAKSGGGPGGENSTSISTDGSGNSYICGTFPGTATFGSFNLVGGGSYIAKYDANGNCLWAVRFDGNVNDVAGAYVTGWFAGTAIIGTTTLTSAGGTIDIFIAKFDQSTGAFTWAKSAGSNMDDDYGTAISFDNSSSPLLTGYFWDQATFGTINLTGTNWETFIARYDPANGNCLSAVAAGGSNNQQSYSIQGIGNTVSYIVGQYAGTATFGATTLNSNAGSTDIFVAKYDAAIPGWVWAKSLGGPGQDEAKDIARVNASPDMYVTGIFSNTMAVGTTTLTSGGFLDAFTARIDANGNWVWAKSGGSSTGYDYSNTMTADNTGCYIAGRFQGPASFGPYNIGSAGLEEVFITHYDASGNELWAINGGGTGNDVANGIAYGVNGIVYATGNYSGTASFGSYSVSATGSLDAFITKICNVSANAGTDVSICNGGNTTLGASGGASYTWSPAAGLSNANIANPVASPTATTNYSVAVTNSLGCTANDVVVVTVNPLPPANAGNDVTICSGATTNLSASGGTSYTWSPPGSLSNANIFNPVASPTATTNYTVTVSDLNGCQNTDVVIVNVNSLPNANAGPDANVCIGTPTLLGASGGISYSWSPSAGLSNPNISNPIATPTVTTSYTVTVTNSVSCSAQDNMTLTVYQLPNVTANSSVLTTCPGNVVALSSTGAIIYSWSPTSGLSNPNSANTNATVNSTTSYTVNGTDGNSCSNSASVTVATVAPSVPDICTVTSDSASLNNIIYWDKTLNMDADSFIVYREVSTNVYSRVGAVSKDSLSLFVDTNRSVGPANGDPNITTYLYKLSVRDTCGNEGAKSPYHTSVYFNDQQTGAFTWNTYVVESSTVTPVTTFELLRDSNNTGFWKVIGTASGTSNILNDPQYGVFQFIANWRVQANGFNCTPTAKYGNNGIQGTIVKSKSNITNNRTTGIKNEKELFSMYPNPAHDQVNINSRQSLGTILILNSLGEVVYEAQSSQSAAQLDISPLPSGIYTLQVDSRYYKLVKQ